MSRPPLPPYTIETAAQKARMAEDAWNRRDPEAVALAYTEDSWWRNRSEFFQGREAIVATSSAVREEVTVIDFDELLAVPDTAPVIATLLRYTPLTQLLDSHPGAPPLHWEDAGSCSATPSSRARSRTTWPRAPAG